MAIHDFTSERLFVDQPLSEGAKLVLGREQMHYLLHVLRLGPGDHILVFNGIDGEWRAEITEASKRGAALQARERVRDQTAPPDIAYLFAPLKHARLDYMVQKATEMGVARLAPVMTRRTIVSRVNLERMRQNVIEAAEQCGVLAVPEVTEPEKLVTVLDGWDATRRLIFCDEEAGVADPVAALQSALEPAAAGASLPLAVLVGPEGGFAPEERESLLSKPFTVPVSLGPRILRADTAGVAVLALVQAVAGDWR